MRDDLGMIGLAPRLVIVALFTLIGLRAAAAAPPHRVVSFNVCADQLVLALADPEQITALSPYATDASISVVAGKARGFRRVPLQAEAVIPLKPDLVLTGPNYRLTEPILRALGIPVAKVDLITGVDAARAQIRMIAALLGHPERGEALVAKLDAAGARLAAAPRPVGATALLVGNGGYTEGPASLAGALLHAAGFKPPPGAPPGLAASFHSRS